MNASTKTALERHSEATGNLVSDVADNIERKLAADHVAFEATLALHRAQRAAPHSGK